jgi:hypothetical protein
MLARLLRNACDLITSIHSQFRKDVHLNHKYQLKANGRLVMITSAEFDINRLTANCIFVQYIVLLFSFINAVSKCSIGCESRDITRSIAMFLYLHIINEGIPQYTYPITIFPCIICAYWCLTHIVLCFLFCFVCLRLVTCIWWCPTHDYRFMCIIILFD